jgi:biopolymer transport protein ExbB/TolQ
MESMKLSPGGVAAVVVTLLLGAGLGLFLHVFVVDLHGNLIGHAAVWGLLLIGAYRLWSAARSFRRLDDDAPTRRLANELPAMLERMKEERDRAAAAALGAKLGMNEREKGEPATGEDAGSSPQPEAPQDRRAEDGSDGEGFNPSSEPPAPV